MPDRHSPSRTRPQDPPPAQVGGPPLSPAVGIPGDLRRPQGFLLAVLDTGPRQTTRWSALPADVARWAEARDLVLVCGSCRGEKEVWPYGEDSRPGDSIPCPDCRPFPDGPYRSDLLDVAYHLGGKVRHRPAQVEDVEEWATANQFLLLDKG